MKNRQIGALAAIVGIVGFAIHHAPSILLGRWAEGGYEGVLPMIGTAGQTVVTYNLLIDITTPIMMFVLAVSLGYYVANRVDIADEYRRVVEMIAIGSVVGSALAAAPVLSDFSTTAGAAFTVFFFLSSFAALVVPVALILTVGALAGAALSHFQTSDDSPPHPVEVDTESQTDSHSEPTR